MMRIQFDETGTPDGLERLAASWESDDAVGGLMVLACDANGWTPDILNPILKNMGKPLFGGVFPQIIHEAKNREKGTLLIALPARPDIACVKGLSDPGVDFDEQLDAYAEAWDHADAANGTLVVFVDGLSKRIAALVQSLFFCLGLDRNFSGGGAGSLSFQQKPCLLAPDGMHADAALVVRLPMSSGIGVAHGWQPISESMKVTAADRNVIQSLEWRPAFEVYRELVEGHSGRRFTDDNFFDLAKCYPFGINKLGAEVVVRDPLMLGEDNSIVCVGEVPEGSFVRLLSGSPDSLVAAANQARELAERSALDVLRDASSALFIDCISRVLYMGDRIEDEFRAAAGDRSLFGALTLGEIANTGRDYLEFYNKTSVLGLLS